MRGHRFAVAVLLAVSFIAPLGAQTPTGTVRGRVTDAGTQQPLAGASVSIGSRVAVSQADGRYLISGVPAGSDSVRIRLIGYARAARTVTLAGGDTVVVDVALTAQAVSLASVVVVGYGQALAANLTGSQSQVGAKDFNTGSIPSPQLLIENKVPGVQVVDNNEPGGGLSIRIRGQASVNAGSEPLYVVDGVPLGTGSGAGFSAGRDPLNFLDPNDIASITVLKDAASAAIYGANASNGVVLITTKSGEGRPRVEYSGSASAASVTRLPSMLNAQQYTNAINTYYPAKAADLLGVSTNWFDLVDQTAMGEQHDVALSGAGATSNYRLSLGYLNQDGILKGTKTERVSVGINYNEHLYNNRLDLTAFVKGSRANDHYTPGGVLYNAAQMGPTQPIFDTSSATIPSPFGPLPPTGYYNWPGSLLTSADNPLEVLNTAIDHGTTDRSVGNLQAIYDFSSINALRGLRGTVHLGYDIAQTNRVTFYPNNIHLETKNGTYGSYSVTSPSQANALLDGYLDYTPPVTLGPGTLALTAGYSYSQSHSDFPSVFATQITTNLFQDNALPPSVNPATASETVTESKLISFFGRANYNVNDRYLAALSLRRDGSSRFGPGNQWGTFPAVSVGWRISREPFLQSVGGLTDLKLRGSWGKTGNQAFGDYLQYSTFQGCNPEAQVQFGGTFVCPFRPSSTDPNIKWESTTTTDLGADYSIFNQRFSGTVDYYNKHTDNLIFTVPACAGCNLSNFVTTNIGTMRNRGFEFSVTGHLVDGGSTGFDWTASLNASHNTNVLLSINPNAVGSQRIQVGGVAGGVGTTIQVLQPGQPINSFFTCPQYYAGGKPVENVYVDTLGDTTSGCDAKSLRPDHDPSPHWMLGFSSSMNYRHFDFSFTMRAWLGNYVYNNIASNLGDYQELNRGEPYNLSTSVLQTGFVAPHYLSDYYVEKASFLRMDNVTVGYSFPWRDQQLRLWASVQNAFTITGYSGVDPTAGLNGIDNNIYPRSRIVTSGLSVQF